MKSKTLSPRLLLGLLSLIFFLNSCKKEETTPPNTDACANITCLNGGYCVNGACSCPAGYSGPNCGTQVTPTKIRVTKIELTRFPATETGGASWDVLPSSGPDITVKITKGTDLIWEESGYEEDANPSSVPFASTPNPAFDLSSPNDVYTISLYDYDDLDSDDFMGGINFTPYSSTNGFPPVLILDAGGSVAFKVYVTYIW